jgi:cysteinyl-tRNA synthetase
MLKIYNSLTRQKEVFTPIQPGTVRMYVCGMTVYDYVHLGHARVLITFDSVVRYLRSRGYAVTYVRNVTDVDDKIIKRAQEHGEDYRELTERFIEAMHEDERALGVLPPDLEPRATAYIPQIQEMLYRLFKRGYAYLGKTGDFYFRVRRFSNYGRLSGKALDELKAGARVEVSDSKEDPLDFVLWKVSKPKEPSWAFPIMPTSPGRPGWHIECSAMSTACLGNHFDIHGGGMDLAFPHHENEIAQSESATGEKFVNTWMHVGFVRVNEEKMSKSLGNFFTVREILKQFSPEVVRYFILASHYRSPLDYSDQSLRAAKTALDGFYLALRGLPREDPNNGAKLEQGFHEAMEDDFNTPKAFAELSALAREINRAKAVQQTDKAAQLGAVLRQLGSPLGLFQQDPEQYLKETSGIGRQEDGNSGSTTAASDAEIQALVDQRTEARRRQNWAESDRIRDQLARQGIVLEDGSDGTAWRRC